MCDLNPEWIAMSSLFYDGRINFYINLDDHEQNGGGEHYYNIYSLPLVKELFERNGYKKFYYEKFDIDIDLPKPKGKEMGTYTVKTEDGERLQISGALLMPWYFVLAKR